MVLHSRLHAGVLAILAALTLAQPAEAQRTPQSYFSPNGGGAAATAEQIGNARESIDVAMYSISTSGVIWKALEDAVNRGVTVRCVLNKATSSNRAKAEKLEEIGVHVFSTSRTMHEKFALIDASMWWRRKLINGSANWSTSAETRYSENTVVYNRHYHLFYAFQQEFNLLLDDARAVSDGAEDHQDVVSLRAPSSSVNRRERAVFSSSNSPNTNVIEDEIIDLMWASWESIKIDVAHFNSDAIARELITIHESYPDIDIQVMVDMGEYGASVSQVKRLEDAGIAVRYKTYSLAFYHPRSQLMHHKTMIVDDYWMITGSYNWSQTAEHSNYENIIVVDDGSGPNEEFVAAFLAEHERLWDQGRELYPRFLDAMTADDSEDAYRAVFPVHFDTDYFRATMSLTREQLIPVRREAYASGLFGNQSASYIDKEAGASGAVFRGTLDPDERFLEPQGSSSGSPPSSNSGAVAALGAIGN